MKKIFKIHPLTYVTLLIVVLTAHFKIYLTFMLLIIIHELGHIIAGIFFQWKIDKIVILPIGAITKYDEMINRPMAEEFIVASMGLVFQLLFYLLIFRNYSIFFYCNLFIVVFNLLPIIPLDGAKLLNLLFNRFLSFKQSYMIKIYLSYIVIFIALGICFLKKDLVFIIAFIPLLINLYQEYRQIPSIINKFYLERYLYNLSFNKCKNIEGLRLSKMKRDYYHYFHIHDQVLSETEVLKNLFG